MNAGYYGTVVRSERMSSKTNRPAERRRGLTRWSGGRFPAPNGVSWWVYLIPAGVLVAVVAFVAVNLDRTSSMLPTSTGQGGLPIGAIVPANSLSATTGGSMSLDNLRGSKVVVYFYEGGG